jgi:hypothetical protein
MATCMMRPAHFVKEFAFGHENATVSASFFFTARKDRREAAFVSASATGEIKNGNAEIKTLASVFYFCFMIIHSEALRAPAESASRQAWRYEIQTQYHILLIGKVARE